MNLLSKFVTFICKIWFREPQHLFRLFLLGHIFFQNIFLSYINLCNYAGFCTIFLRMDNLIWVPHLLRLDLFVIVFRNVFSTKVLLFPVMILIPGGAGFFKYIQFGFPILCMISFWVDLKILEKCIFVKLIIILMS